VCAIAAALYIGKRQIYSTGRDRPEVLGKLMETKLYVGNLSFSTTEEQLRTLFTQADTATSVELIKDRSTGSSKGFAFVEMSNQAEAEKAIKMLNGFSLDNREIKVNTAKPKEDFGRGSGGGNNSFGSKRRF
jgi:cold-inducible RNA-binding protein